MSGPLPSVMLPLTAPLSWGYGAAVRWRNARFDRGSGVQRVDRPVVSVGNITVGGTGKTPVVAWLATQLRRAGHSPAIALRGYAAGPEGSDEALEYQQVLPRTPILVGADRARTIRDAIEAGREFDVVLLDDGFQHRRLHRNLDLVLIDRRRSGLDSRLLPGGWLREPPESLRRADGVIVTHAEEVDEALATRLAQWHGAPPVAWFRHLWRDVTIHAPPAPPETRDLGWFEGRRLVAVLGVGNPAGIVAAAVSHGAQVIRSIPARDHQRYDARLVRRIASAADAVDGVLTTRKDWVKLERLIDSAFPLPIVVPSLELEPIDGGAALCRRLVEAVRSSEAAPPVPSR